ncbi:heat shock protein beta-7 [Amia ocellicauda]|uniref:heat shock protein beta-7 n=1 Tax=Amia ocellicauda TaxID=2972642 RepID=UPI003464DBA0
MASLTNSSSNSAFRSSRYSSSFRAEGNSSHGDSIFEPYLEPGSHSLFTEEGAGTPLCHPQFSRHPRESFGYPGPTSPVSGRPASMGALRSVGDSYQMSADVSQFEPQDVVVMSYNQCIVIHAEKLADDGTIINTFTHKCQFPEDMDPLSVSCARTDAGMVVVSVKRNTLLSPSEPPPPSYRSEARF